VTHRINDVNESLEEAPEAAY